MPLRRQQHDKQPNEEYPIDINFGPALPLGATELVSAIASAVKWPRRRPTEITEATSEILLSDTAIILNPPYIRARIFLKGGTDNYDYKITILGNFDNGAKLEEELYVRVREE